MKAAARLQGLWRHADFMRLWTAAEISAAGSQITLLALPLTAILVLHASAFEVAAISTAVTLPYLLGIAAGVWLDRVRRRRVMIAADFGRTAVLASVPAAYAFGVVNLPQLYAVALASGALTVFFEIASQAYLPSIVRREELVEANAKLQGATVAAQGAGPSIGGALVTLVSAPVAILADAASFLVSGLLIGSISERGRHDSKRNETPCSAQEPEGITVAVGPNLHPISVRRKQHATHCRHEPRQHRCLDLLHHVLPSRLGPSAEAVVLEGRSPNALGLFPRNIG